MKSSDRTILMILPAIALLIGFWVLVLSPKQSESGDLQGQVDELQSSLSLAQGQIASGQQARDSFKSDYADLVSLGAAAPAADDQATLVYDMSKLGEANGVRFRSFQVTQKAGEAPAAAAPATTAPAPATTTPTTAAVTPATEASVAVLPLGATVGAAGLPLMPYDFNYLGSFFDFADFFGDLDAQVKVTDDGSGPTVQGRLLTVDGFALTANPKTGFPDVQADLSVTSYIVPDDEGLGAGASPAGPGATTTPDSTVTSTTVPTAGVTP